MRPASLLVLPLLVACGQIPPAPEEQDELPLPAPEQPPPITGERPRVVFVTSEFLDGGMGGLRGADAICQEHARFGQLTGTFKAWLADDRESPSTRMTRGKGPYRRTDGMVVAKDWDDLVDGTLAAPIDRDERGLAAEDSFICAGDSLWSNVGVGGVRRVGAPDCSGWTSANISITGAQGSFRSSGQMWMQNGCEPSDCDELMAIYCVEQ